MLESQKELFAKRNTRVAAFNIDEMPRDRTIQIINNNLLKKYGLTFPLIFSKTEDELASVRDPYKAFATPSAYLLDSEGKIVFSHIGVLTPPELEAALDTLP